MTYNPDNPQEHSAPFDPYEAAMTDPPKCFFGLLRTETWTIVGIRDDTKRNGWRVEDWVEELHGSQDEIKKDRENRFLGATSEFSITPLDPTYKVITRKVGVTNYKQKEFRQVVRPSIEALGERIAEVKGLVPGQFNLLKEFTDLWVSGEWVPNPDNKVDENWRTLKFTHVYQDQVACAAASAEYYNREVETEAPAEDNGRDAEKAALIPFVKPLWEQAQHDPSKMAELLAANPLLSMYFTMDSPEVQQIVSE